MKNQEACRKEACEITVPKTDKQKPGIHVEIDIVKNLEFTSYSYMELTLFGSFDWGQQKKRSTFVTTALTLAFLTVVLTTGSGRRNKSVDHRIVVDFINELKSSSNIHIIISIFCL